MKLLLTLLFPIMVFAQSFLISNIPIPKTYIQNLDPYECDTECLQVYLDNGQIFSFLAHATRKLEDETLNEVRSMNISILNLGSQQVSSQVKIAMLLPYKKIGKYASSTTNAVFSYLITRGHHFELKSYKIESEDEEEIRRVLQQIKSDGFYYVIAPLTKKGAQNVVNIDEEVNVYFPTINVKDIEVQSSYITYGAIDYEAQANLLMKEAISPLVIFSDKSLTGKKLAHYEAEAFKYIDTNKTLNPDNTTIKYFISRRTTNLERYLKENEKIIEGSFVINTPIVKSGMIMSQLTLYDVNATNILSTQVNYDPLLLSMTQYNDRKDMVVANSITEHNNVLTQTNAILGNDIVYDWINYTTTIGIDYFFNQLTGEEREYKVTLENNQMLYEIELLQPSVSRFVEYIHIDRTLLEGEETEE